VDLRFGLLFLIGLILYFWHWEKLFFLALIPSGLIASLRCSLMVEYGDTGIYHAQIMMGHAFYGMIPGFANLVVQYGYPSTWFSLFAPFFHLVPAEYLLQLPSTLILQMLLVPLFLVLFQNRSKTKDRFLAASLLVIVLLLTKNPVFPSSNADLCIMLCYPCIYWMILNIGFRPILIFLAALACAIKLHAIVLYLFVLAGFQRKTFRLVPLVQGFCVLGLILLPSSLDSIFRSGYLFLPLPLPGLMLPWTNFEMDVSKMQQGISEFARWGYHPVAGSPFWGWLESWPIREWMFLSLFLLSTLFAFKLKNHWLPIGFGLGGSLIFWIIAPSWRYALGSLILLPAWFLAPSLKRIHFVLLLPLCLLQIYFHIKGFPDSEWGRSMARHHYAYKIFMRSQELSEAGAHTISAALLYQACQEKIEEACADLLWKQSEFNDLDWHSYYQLITPEAISTLLQSEELVYTEKPSTLYFPKSVKSKSASVLSGIYQGNQVSAFLGETNHEEIGYCWTAPLPCAKADMMGSWEFIDPAKGLSSGIRPINLNHRSISLRYLRDLMGRGDLTLVQDELQKRCESGQELECALHMRFRAFEALRLHDSTTAPEAVTDCLKLVDPHPKAAWRCAYEANTAKMPDAQIILKNISSQIPITDLLSAPGCRRVSQAIPCKHY